MRHLSPLDSRVAIASSLAVTFVGAYSSAIFFDSKHPLAWASMMTCVTFNLIAFLRIL